jgi:hypothetical protein
VYFIVAFQGFLMMTDSRDKKESPGFKHDLFISYAHFDNRPLYESDQGWVDRLHDRLEIILTMWLGEKLEIWRDLKLHGNDHFGPEMLERLSQSALILSVLSPSHIKSEWCQKELRAFHQRAAANGGIHINNKSRVFKVCKTPVNQEAHPPELQGILGYEFFGLDQKTKRLQEFSDEVGPNRDKRYWDKLDVLAQDIKELIEYLRHPQPSTAKPFGKTIYLAETTSDRRDDRDRIRSELKLNGYQVLPDKPLSLDHRLRDEVNNYLAVSHLAVHLIGANYGIVPENESTSIVELQRELASVRMGAAGFSQLIWMPPGLSSTDERQQRFIGELANHLNLPSGTVLLQFKLEDLKTFIHEKLNPPAPSLELPNALSGNGDPRPVLVYIVYDQPDQEAVKPIADCLFNRGFEPFLLPGDADPKMHMECLQQCDAVLTYCGKTTDGWLQMKRMELLKLSGYRTTKPITAFYLSGPQTSGKTEFRVRDGIIIRHFAAFADDSLQPFIELLERARGGQQ